MGAGKTVVGKGLARELRWRFVDLDEVIEAREKRSISEIFSAEGESVFRAKEKAALQKLLARNEQIIALGGGAILDPENLRLLKRESLLIWLAASAATVLGRGGSSTHRPLLEAPDRLERIEELLEARESFYDQAHVKIETDRLTVDEVVKNVLAAARALDAE